MKGSSTKIEEKILLDQLRQILLTEDRATLEALKNSIDDPVEFSKKVTPVVNERINFIKNNFPAEFGKEVEIIVDRRLKESQDELLNIIYPVMGRMMRKYVGQQIQLLKDGIDKQVQKVFSFQRIKQKFRSVFLGVKESDILLSELNKPIVEEVFVIQRNSGLLMGNYSRSNVVEQDLVAGMLTAIKSFVEDAFKQEQGELELIQYQDYRIFIQNFHSYYIAVAVTGVLGTLDQAQLAKKINNFAGKEIPTNIKEVDSTLTTTISKKLEQYFKTKVVQPS